jgi:hypothetical protein
MSEQFESDEVFEQEPEQEPSAYQEPESPPEGKKKRSFGEAFKNFAITFSFIVNVILVLVLLISPFPTLVIVNGFVEPLLGDLDNAFAALGDTKIETNVDLQQPLDIRFDLPLEQDTNVVLTEPVPLQANATFFLPGGGGSINGTVSLSLPEGMQLPVSLSLMVPVETTIPVQMDVPVEIQLDEAGMGPAIEQLRGVFAPVNELLDLLPNYPQERLLPR